MIAQLPSLNTILKRHEIHPKFWPELRAFVEEGVRPSKEVLTRLNHVTNYKAALAEILAELSKDSEHKFPPADYQSPVPYESLFLESPVESEALASAGAPSAAR